MLNSPLKTAIDQLVSLRYPLSDLKPVTARTNKIDPSESNFRADQQEKARLFRAELEQMTAEEVQRLLATERETAYKKYEERRTEEERARPFNQAYGFDVNANRTRTSGEIVGDLQRLGLSLDEDTVRKYLQEAKGLIPPEPKE
jgi:flagellar biosynthesis GTPase FlhF